MNARVIGGVVIGMIGVAGLAGWAGNTSNMAEARSAAGAGTYEVDNVHSNVVFKVRHVGAANFYGRFNDISGTVGFEDGRVTSAEISVETGSVDTKNNGRDKHLKGADFFNARQYPEITFSGTSADGRTLTGELTLHGVTREVTAEVVDTGSGEMRGTPKVGFEAHFSIRRSDFDMRGYLADDLSDDGPLGNNVHIIVAIEANG